MPLSKSSIPKEYWALAALLLLGVFVVSPGFFSIDEAIYYLGARAIAEQGSLGLHNNGYEQFHSEALKIRGLVDGPQGLTPQYPAGSALLAAPLLWLLGPRAFILINALAAIGTLFTARKICLSQFKSEKVARIAIVLLVFGTFWAEYALGQWPHMLAVYLSTQAFWLALRHLESEQAGCRYAFLAGLFAGFGMLFRLDAVLAVPAIGLIMFIFADRFVRSSVLFGIGVLPSAALASWFNYLKFGTVNPFSYGKSGGNADITAYWPLFGALILAFGALFLWRKSKGIPRTAVIGAVLLAGLIMISVPAAHGWLLRSWHGFLALVVDARYIEETRVGVQRGPGNTLVFWGLAKKALGQSMPWIGLMAMPIAGGFPARERRFFTMLLIFMATMMVPFVLRSWHGGGGSNMRYFLPALPIISIFCAKLVDELWHTAADAVWLATAGVWLALLLCFAWMSLHPSKSVGLQQILATYVFLTMTGVAFAAGLNSRFQRRIRGLAVAALGASFMMAMGFAMADFGAAAKRRASNYHPMVALEKLPSQSLVIVAYPEWTGVGLPGNSRIVAADDSRTRQTDPELIFDALDAGYRVFLPVQDWEAPRILPVGIESRESGFSMPEGQIVELRRTADRPRNSGQFE